MQYGNRIHGVIRDKSKIDAVGHRVAHGGEMFHAPVMIDKVVIAAIRGNIPLVPLHNPANLSGLEVARSIFPDGHVTVFDTVFHQSMPENVYLYPIPYELYERHRIRRYGFHGTSHAYVSEKAAEFLNIPLDGLCLITIHLGNGASMAAVKHGKCVDTTMGMTPLEYLVMGVPEAAISTLPYRSILPASFGMGLAEVESLLNKKSGLKGDLRRKRYARGPGKTECRRCARRACHRHLLLPDQ
uniref:Acetate kinase n=1 Tax=Candidatus Kentrum sp. LFY TaxID=2126342 RepID=A0A450UUS4_9GAMM|nr:MAG: acetate kinase [Candidatus Kentron sp. LFY]